MNCPNCNQSVEADATFCGNCGQQLQAAAATANVPVPNYAVTAPSQHAGEMKALLALLFGITGIVGSLFMALIGLALGIAGLVMGTMSRSSTKRGLSTVGLAVSSLAILVGLGVWTYAIKHNQSRSNDIASAQSNIPANLAADLSTPCYSIGFVSQLNISNSPPSCDMKAFNGQSLASSSDAYKIFANKAQIGNATTFATIAKQAIEKDIKNSLPGFVIDSQRLTTFAGSPAYVVNVSDPRHNIAAVEAAVLHQVGTGDNVFILVHATNGDTTDLRTLEAQWQWK